MTASAARTKMFHNDGQWYGPRPEKTSKWNEDYAIKTLLCSQDR